MKRSTLLYAAAGLLLSLPALASEENGEPGGVFAGDVGNALWTLVIFAVVIFVLGKFAWRPILDGLTAREKFIRTALEDAQRDRAESEARLREYTDKLNAARVEATAIVEEARRDADVVKRRIEEEASAEAAKIVERAKREIGLARETAVKELYSLSAKLTTDLAGKILRREINPRDHERLIRESIDKLASGEN
jgi:F-type H+-transporting ATPase subunit b